MSSSAKDTLKMINHYKKSLQMPDVDDKRILHCLSVLYKLRVSVQSLQETGIGRTVNGLCKSDAEEVRSAARALVSKWKELVVNESEEEPCRNSQEEGERANEQRHNQRKDADRIKKERDHRSAQHHSQQQHQQKEHHSSSQESKHKSSRRDEEHHKSSSKERPQASDPDKSAKEHRHHSKKSSSSSSSFSQSISGKEGESRKRPAEDRDQETASSSSKRRHKSEGSSSRSKHREDKEKRREKKSDDDEGEGIDGSAGTSFADALAMMDGSAPAKPHKLSSASSSGRTKESNGSKSAVSSSKTVQSNSHKEKERARSKTSSTSTSSTSKSSIDSRAIPGSSRSTSSGSGPPKLLAPSMKLAPLLDPEEMKKDILGPSVVIGNSYTPSSFVSASIQKNKRPGGGQPVPPIDANNFEILQSKARTKVYSGNKGAATVLSLHEMCIRVLQKNVDALEYTGGVPFDILEPVLLKCSAAQLDQIEYYNPYLSEDTNDLWKMHVTRQFRGKKRQEMESWREMYQRCQTEESDRLSMLTSSIKQSQQTSIPVKQTKLAYMDSKAPPMGRRRAPGWGSGGGGGGPSINASLTSRTAVNGTRMGFLTAGREVQAKRAPLMQKTLALMKKSIKR